MVTSPRLARRGLTPTANCCWSAVSDVLASETVGTQSPEPNSSRSASLRYSGRPSAERYCSTSSSFGWRRSWPSCSRVPGRPGWIGDCSAPVTPDSQLALSGTTTGSPTATTSPIAPTTAAGNARCTGRTDSHSRPRNAMPTRTTSTGDAGWPVMTPGTTSTTSAGTAARATVGAIAARKSDTPATQPIATVTTSRIASVCGSGAGFRRMAARASPSAPSRSSHPSGDRSFSTAAAHEPRTSVATSAMNRTPGARRRTTNITATSTAVKTTPDSHHCAPCTSGRMASAATITGTGASATIQALGASLRVAGSRPSAAPPQPDRSGRSATAVPPPSCGRRASSRRPAPRPVPLTGRSRERARP